MAEAANKWPPPEQTPPKLTNPIRDLAYPTFASRIPRTYRNQRRGQVCKQSYCDDDDAEERGVEQVFDQAIKTALARNDVNLTKQIISRAEDLAENHSPAGLIAVGTNLAKVGRIGEAIKVMGEVRNYSFDGSRTSKVEQTILLKGMGIGFAKFVRAYLIVLVIGGVVSQIKHPYPAPFAPGNIAGTIGAYTGGAMGISILPTLIGLLVEFATTRKLRPNLTLRERSFPFALPLFWLVTIGSGSYVGLEINVDKEFVANLRVQVVRISHTSERKV